MDISTDGLCGALNVDLIFHYTDDELANGSNITESELKTFKYNGTTWDNMGGAVDTAANTVRLNGVTALSNWTIGDPTGSNGNPTALGLQFFAARAPGSRWAGLLVAVVWGLSVGVVGWGGWRSLKRWRLYP